MNQLLAAPHFFRVLKTSGWRKKLRHRGKTTHAKCSTCHKLKNKIRKAKSLQEHAAACRWLFEAFSWSMCRSEVLLGSLDTGATIQQDLIVAIQDSMDKSKFSIPRYADGICPKALEQKVRPQCEVTACIVHGRGIFSFMWADPDLSFGSDWSIESVQPQPSNIMGIGATVRETLAKDLQIVFRQHPEGEIGWSEFMLLLVGLVVHSAWMVIHGLHHPERKSRTPCSTAFCCSLTACQCFWQRGPMKHLESWTHSRGCRSQSQYLHPMQSDVCPLKMFYVIFWIILLHLASSCIQDALFGLISRLIREGDEDMFFILVFAWTHYENCAATCTRNSCWTQPLCAPSVRQSSTRYRMANLFCTGWLDVTPTSHTCQCPLAETWCVHTISNMSGPTRGFWIQSWRSTSTRKNLFFSRLAMWTVIRDWTGKHDQLRDHEWCLQEACQRSTGNSSFLYIREKGLPFACKL